MNVAVTGATGFIGRRLVAALRGRGHTVTALVRDPTRARVLLGESVACVAWDAAQARGEAWERALAESDAVFNLAGEPISQRWTEASKARIMASRVDATRHLVDAIARAPRKPGVLLNSSGISHYGDTGDTPVDEASPAGPASAWIVQVTTAWEREAVRAADAGVREVRLRTGVVLGESGGALEKMLTPFKLFAGGPVGGGDQWMPWVHMDDALGIMLHALDAGERVRGPVNVVAPNPVRMREFARELGRVLRRPAWLPVPRFAVKAAMGEMAQLVTDSVRAVPRVALETGYVFKYPELAAALADVLTRAA